jgi:hypothetical protein
MININSAIYALYPQVKHFDGENAFDVDFNKVTYDLATVTAKAQADEQSAKDAKASALAKLAALGLTQDEVKALVG